MKLLIGNKNYSSWSLRPWLLMKHADIPFEEIKLHLFSPHFYETLAKHSPTGKVPVLIHSDVVVWDTLAICEYVAEQFPEKSLWPATVKNRARARSLVAEMHSGFANLRSNMGMNIEADLKGYGWNLKVQKDIDRICQAWTEALAQSGGPFLFGHFTIADAFFAPVCTRFVTYGVPLPAVAQHYVQTIMQLPAMQQWISDAKAEKEFLQEDEAYRSHR